jgi:hypothetical protein
MEARRQAELEEEFKPVSADWCIGSEQFRADLLKYIEEQRGKWHYGSELWESAQAKAEHLVAEALHNHGLPEAQLGRWRKRHPFKIKLALQLRAETTVTLDWIACRLKMGTRGHLAHLLHLHDTRPTCPDDMTLSLTDTVLGDMSDLYPYICRLLAEALRRRGHSRRNG